MTEFRQMLTRGFANARDRGYFARQSWKCCQSCGCAAVPFENRDGYVFYHAQDAARIADDERAGRPPSVYLAWSGDGEEISKCFLEAGLAVEWNGSEARRIRVAVPPVEVPAPSPDAEYVACLDALLAR